MNKEDGIRGLIDHLQSLNLKGTLRDVAMRKAKLARMEHWLVQHRDQVLYALENDLGKPEVEAFLAEYYFVLQEIRLVRKKLGGWVKARRVSSPIYFWPCRSRVTREAYGVVLIIAPWNYPLQLSLAPLISAVAAGNMVLLKPSEKSAECGKLLGKMMAECFPEGEVKVVLGGGDLGGLLMQEKWDFVFFTGSTKTGRQIAKSAAEHLTPVGLELGGKCPCIVDYHVDLKKTARRILMGKFFNAGQTCFAPDYVAVKAGHREPVVEALKACLLALPWEEEMARMVDLEEYKRVLSLISGKVIKKGKDDIERLHLAPRILPEASWECPAMQHEVFGPLLPVVEFTSKEQLIDKIAEMGDPLAAYVFSKDDELIAEMSRSIRSGSLCIKDTMKQATNLSLPFGGVGTSGHGRYRGQEGINLFSYERSETRRYFLHDPFEMLPPRGKAWKWIKRVLR